MKRHAREILKKMGSERADILGWRDMWAMVAKKGEKMYGESFSKSAGFNTWGSTVLLKVEVPLVSFEGKYLEVFYARLVSGSTQKWFSFQRNKIINILSIFKTKLSIFNISVLLSF